MDILRSDNKAHPNGWNMNWDINGCTMLSIDSIMFDSITVPTVSIKLSIDNMMQPIGRMMQPIDSMIQPINGIIQPTTLHHWLIALHFRLIALYS